MKDKKLTVKILVPVVIVVVIVGMWLIKNTPEKEETADSQSQVEQENIAEEIQGADFTLKVSKQIDFEELAKYGLPVIADYGSDDCIPCKQMAPVLETMNEEFSGKAFIKFADVWKYQDSAGNVPIQLIPTQVLFHADGTPFVPSDELQQEMEFIMYSDRESGEHVFTVHQGGLSEEQFRKILSEMGVE